MKALAHLNKYFYRYRVRLLLGLFFVIISNLFGIWPAKIIRQSLDLVTQAIITYRNKGIVENDYAVYAHAVLQFGTIILLMALLKGVFMFFMRQTIIVMSRLIEYDLKNEVYAQYQRLGLSFYRRNNTGDLMARISEDVGRVRMYVGPAIMYTANTVVLFTLVMYSMFRVDVKLTLYVLIPLPAMAYSIYYVSNLINKKSEQVQAQLSNLSTFAQESFSGIRVIKAYTKEDVQAIQWEKESETYNTRTMNLVGVNALFSPTVLTMMGLSTLLAIYVGGKEVIAGRVSAGNVAEFIVYINLLTWPITSVGWVTSLVQRAAASQQRINEFLQIQPDITSLSNEPIEVIGKIEFKDVSFIYPDTGVEALKGVSFKVAPGQSLAILGRTGCGKSTVAALVGRMYDVTGGGILIDERPINVLPVSALRNAIGYVPQDVFLFSDSIANNISFGLNNENEPQLKEKIAQAAKDAEVYHNIMEFPEKMETQIGERGITLSGGQKQRVSIARAIIKQPKILIFDDCLSAVDTQTEERILNNFKRVMQQRTTIIISHRVSTVKHADTIIVLADGRVTEQGSHAELIALKGYYASLYEKQLLEEEMA